MMVGGACLRCMSRCGNGIESPRRLECRLAPFGERTAEHPVVHVCRPDLHAQHHRAVSELIDKHRWRRIGGKAPVAARERLQSLLAVGEVVITGDAKFQIDQPRRQIAMRGGLAMVDRLAVDRFGKRFVTCADREQRSLLDEIAYTSNPDRGMSQAIAFFSSFRDLTASGFWSTKMGVADLQYQGNVFVSEWKGCPDAALKKLGLI